jgi:hypothetical protein
MPAVPLRSDWDAMRVRDAARRLTREQEAEIVALVEAA